MIKGGLGKNVRLTVPYIYIEPAILKKEGEVDKAVFSAIEDIWNNYNVNLRYLTVLPDGSDTENYVPEDMENLTRKWEVTTESQLLSRIQPNIVVCFFGRKEVLPSNHKVYNRDELVNNYHLILSNLYQKDRQQPAIKQRYRKRRD